MLPSTTPKPPCALPANRLQPAHPAQGRNAGSAAELPQTPACGASVASNMARSQSAASTFQSTQKKQNDGAYVVTTLPQRPTPEAVAQYLKQHENTRNLHFGHIAFFCRPKSESTLPASAYTEQESSGLCPQICAQIDPLSDRVVATMGSGAIGQGVYGSGCLQTYFVSLLYQFENAGHQGSLSFAVCKAVVAAYTKAAFAHPPQTDQGPQRALEAATDALLKLNRNDYSAQAQRIMAYSQNMPLFAFIPRACENLGVKPYRYKSYLGKLNSIAQTYLKQKLGDTEAAAAPAGSAVAHLVCDLSVDGLVDEKKCQAIFNGGSWDKITYLTATISILKVALLLLRDHASPDLPRHAASPAAAQAGTSAAPPVGDKRSFTEAFEQTPADDTSAALPAAPPCNEALSEVRQEAQEVEVFPGVFFKWPDSH
jgi:hypothetical protein